PEPIDPPLPPVACPPEPGFPATPPVPDPPEPGVPPVPVTPPDPVVPPLAVAPPDPVVPPEPGEPPVPVVPPEPVAPPLLLLPPSPPVVPEPDEPHEPTVNKKADNRTMSRLLGRWCGMGASRWRRRKRALGYGFVLPERPLSRKDRSDSAAAPGPKRHSRRSAKKEAPGQAGLRPFPCDLTRPRPRVTAAGSP